MRKNEVALLPSPKTLKAYTGSSRADVGFTDLIKERLLMEKKNLTEQQLKVHLIVDAAAIKPVEAYMKNVDKLVGHVDMAGVVEPVEEGALANKLLTFVINGLSKSFSIIVGYFLVKKLTASQLLELTKHVIKEIEALGFQVEGLVADNASTNTKMFKLLNPEGILCHQVPHPNDKKGYFSLVSTPPTLSRTLATSSLIDPLNGTENVSYLITSSDCTKNKKILC